MFFHRIAQHDMLIIPFTHPTCKGVLRRQSWDGAGTVIMYFPFEKQKLEEQIRKLARHLGENVSLRSLKCLTQYFSLPLVPKLV